MIFRILVKMQDTIKHYKTFSHPLIFFPLPSNANSFETKYSTEYTHRG